MSSLLIMIAHAKFSLRSLRLGIGLLYAVHLTFIIISYAFNTYNASLFMIFLLLLMRGMKKDGGFIQP